MNLYDFRALICLNFERLFINKTLINRLNKLYSQFKKNKQKKHFLQFLSEKLKKSYASNKVIRNGYKHYGY